MKMIKKYTIFVLLMMFSISPVMADDSIHQSCLPGATVELGKMGEVNEQVLLEHIDSVKQKMKNVRHARGSHLSQKLAFKQHLEQMQSAMQALHNQMYAEGCKDAMHGASLEVRLSVMEKQMEMIQQMMEQMIEHFLERAVSTK